ncbi:MAG: dTDP-4-amino-4,6-dideoxygalactose transaminase [Clostridia bacterium]|nr:dTDP-4-amino-4,6-dideoxygalactose transaminase [Clostridia bacterium]
MIDFNIPLSFKKGNEYIKKAINNRVISGDGEFTKKVKEYLDNKIGSYTLLTTSGSTALDMSALLLNIKEGDEVIMPSFTFTSTANSFAIKGAKIVFVDIRPDTMNIDEKLIEDAITSKTKAIVPVHYAGVSCEMDTIMTIAKKYNLKVVEDAAQGVISKYKDKYLGTIGDIGCFSFHETKNYNMGEGGAIIINDKEYIDRAEIIREKGTNRTQFYKGKVDKYTWYDIGSSYLPSDINAAFLYSQLEVADKVNKRRLKLWNLYYENLKDLKEIELPYIPNECSHNAHIFYIKAKNIKERTELIDFLKNNEILTVFHYIPLHTSIAGKKYGRFNGIDKYTTRESERLLRLPMFYKLKESEILTVCKKIHEFYEKR